MNGNGPRDPMAGHRPNRDVAPILEHWMAEVAPHRAPERLLEEAFARTMVARQLPVYPWHGLRLGRSRGAPSNRIGGLALVGVALAVVLAVGAGLLPRRDSGIVGQPSPTPSPASPSPSPPIPSPTASAAPFPSAIVVEPTARIPVTGPITIATDGASIWLFTATGELVRIDPATNAVAATVQMTPSADQFQSLAGNRSGLWVTDWDPSLLLRFDPRTLRSIASISTAGQSKGVLVTSSGAVWIANTRGGSVEKIDPATNTVAGRISLGPVGPSGPNWLAEGLGSIWVGTPNNSTVARISEATNTIQATIDVGPPASPCGGLAVGTTAVWITSCDGSNFVAQIDPATNRVVATIDLRGRGYTFAMIADRPWVSPIGGQLVRLDPVSHTVDRVVAPGSGFSGGGDVVVAAGSLWVIDGAANRVLRLPIEAFGT